MYLTVLESCEYSREVEEQEEEEEEDPLSHCSGASIIWNDTFK